MVKIISAPSELAERLRLYNGSSGPSFLGEKCSRYICFEVALCCTALYQPLSAFLFNCSTNLLQSFIKNAFTIKLCEVCHLSSLLSLSDIYLWKDVSSRTSSLHQAREGGGTPPVTRQTKLRFLFSPDTSRTPWRTTAWLLSDIIRGLSGGSGTRQIFKYFIIIFTNIDKYQTSHQTF